MREQMQELGTQESQNCQGKEEFPVQYGGEHDCSREAAAMLMDIRSGEDGVKG